MEEQRRTKAEFEELRRSYEENVAREKKTYEDKLIKITTEFAARLQGDREQHRQDFCRLRENDEDRVAMEERDLGKLERRYEEKVAMLQGKLNEAEEANARLAVQMHDLQSESRSRACMSKQIQKLTQSVAALNTSETG